METKMNQLMHLFADKTFIEEIKDVEDFAALFNAVQMKIPEVTKEELKDFTTELAVEVKRFMAQRDDDSFSEEELEAVTGGVTLLTIAVVGAMWAVGGYIGWKVGKYLFG